MPPKIRKWFSKRKAPSPKNISSHNDDERIDIQQQGYDAWEKEMKEPVENPLRVILPQELRRQQKPVKDDEWDDARQKDFDAWERQMKEPVENPLCVFLPSELRQQKPVKFPKIKFH